DLEYNPGNYPELLKPMLDGSADVVYGSRFAGGRARRVLFFHHHVANRILTTLSNVTTNLNLTDMETGCKVIRGDYFRAVPLQSDGFGFEPEFTAKIARMGLRVYEVPVDYHGRTYAAGKKINWLDGIVALYTIFRYWLFPGLKGMPPGMQALFAMRSATRYNRRLYERIRPFLGERVFEAGAGLGALTEYLQAQPKVLAADADPACAEWLKNAFRNSPNVETVLCDVADAEACAKLASQGWDTVVCVNVLEHIDDDDAALKVFHSMLEPGGRLVLLVPCGRWLFGEMDRAFGHRRRYERGDIASKMAAAGFAVERVFGHNRLASIPWFVNGRVFRRSSLPWMQAKICDLSVPLLRMVDPYLPLPPLSLAAVGRKAPAENGTA
ncbi:MAG TPA: methyltransferase domain-containing protein, partial [Planctomycetes bacterium]|nr:methyltransferase domain-containing protein [Planctomycetota bacterium]